MPVIIQDFEVVAEAPPAQRESREETRESAPSALLDPVTAARMVRALEVRALQGVKNYGRRHTFLDGRPIIRH